MPACCHKDTKLTKISKSIFKSLNKRALFLKRIFFNTIFSIVCGGEAGFWEWNHGGYLNSTGSMQRSAWKNVSILVYQSQVSHNFMSCNPTKMKASANRLSEPKQGLFTAPIPSQAYKTVSFSHRSEPTKEAKDRFHLAFQR